MGSYKKEWRIPHLEIKKGMWYVCVQDWSDDGWLKFKKGDVVQAVRDNCFLDCYNIMHSFKKDGICYFRPADEDEIPKDVYETPVFSKLEEKICYIYNGRDEDFDKLTELEIAHIKDLAKEVKDIMRDEVYRSLPHWEPTPLRDSYCTGYSFNSGYLENGSYRISLAELDKLPKE